MKLLPRVTAAFIIAFSGVAHAASGDAISALGEQSPENAASLRGDRPKVHRRLQKQIMYVADDKQNFNTGAFPLGECEGDCDNDSNCAGSLRCFQRNAGQSVPGCSGGSSRNDNKDFCYDPGSQPTPSPPSPSPPTGGGGNIAYVADDKGNFNTGAFPLGECEGDCDNDSQCAGSLRCFQRNAGQSVPGCSGGSSRNDNKDFCYSPNGNAPTPTPPTPSPPTGGNQIAYVADDKQNFNTGAFPLGRCEGDCDNDSDCAGSLRCFQRNAGQSVPGCSGGSSRNDNKDFCYEPDGNAPTPTPPTPSPPTGGTNNNGVIPLPSSGQSPVFRFKLHWQQGYFWQEETTERKWCVDCNGRCDPGVQLKIEHCSTNRFDYFRFLYRSGNQVQIQVEGENLCLERVGNRDLRMERCDSGEVRQRFILQNGSIATRFEIEPANFRGWCITQRHHPKPDETLALESTPGVRIDETSYWNAY